MNQINITGRIGQDAEVKQIGDTFVHSFSVAVNEGYHNGTEWVDKTLWINIDFWSAKKQDRFMKGRFAAVNGKLQSREYEGKTYWSIKAHRVETVEAKPKDNNPARSLVNDNLPF